MSDTPIGTLFESRAHFREWLEEHQDEQEGIWLIHAKKGSKLVTVSYAEALDVALEFGWIDGTKRGGTDSFVQKYTPRRSHSPWSMRNRTIVEAMIAEGRMSPRGLAEVERARADGRWERASAGSATAEPPADFLAALEYNPAAALAYSTLNSQNRFAIYYRLQDAKRQDTRDRRIIQFVDMLLQVSMADRREDRLPEERRQP